MARQERRRVLLLFAVSILPPLILLTVLAVIAARNDQAALRHVQVERTHQTAIRTSAELRAAIRAAEEDLIGGLDLALLREPNTKRKLETMFREAAKKKPLARRYLAVELESGALLWPDPSAPFRLPQDRAPLPRETGVRDYRLLAELQAAYARSRRQAAEGRFEEAIAGLQRVVASPAATATLAARAASRLGRCLEEIDQPVAARQAYLRAAQAPIPVRDEEGRPIRVNAALRRCELLLREGDPEEAGDEAIGLARALILGRRRDDVGREEWQDFLEQTRNVLSQAGLQDRDLELGERQAEILGQVQWRQTLDKLLPPLLEAARRTQTGEIRHHFRLGSPPQILAYRVLPAVPTGSEANDRRSGPILFAAQLDLGVLAKDVLRPACGAVSLKEEAAIAVVDGTGVVRAYAGAAAKPDAAGRLSEDTPSVSAPLQAVPLWRVLVTRSTQAMEQAARNRLVLYGALIALTLLTALAGAIATIRYVERSLELAKMKSDFVSNITHELKTPLTSIKMYGELLTMGVKNPEKATEYAQHIVREGNRLQKLIEDVLDFARQDTGKHEYVLAEEDVADTVAEALDLFRHSAKVRGFDLFVELPPVGKLPPVDLDRDAIVRSVLNLLSNAVKYSTDERYVKLVVGREEDSIAITVEDKGIGIDPEDLEKIFDRFYRAGDELTRGVSGAGLGLSLIDQIVQAHGGQIRVASEKGVGSAFTILLPIVEDFRAHWPPGSSDSTPPDAESELLATADDTEDASGEEPEAAPAEGAPEEAETPEVEEDAPAAAASSESAEERG